MISQWFSFQSRQSLSFIQDSKFIHLRRNSLILSLTFLLSACQMFSVEPVKSVAKDTIADLQPVALNVGSFKGPAVSTSEVIEHYTHLLPLVVDPEQKLKVLHRLADLKLQEGEVLMADKAIDELDVAKDAYLGLLEKYPESSENDEVLYQLAKTYDLKGLRAQHLETLTRLASQFPNSRHIVEVQFRRGELLFSDDEFQQAEAAFSFVAHTDNEVFKANAFYMQGWSLFKQNRYADALASYIQVMDLLLAQQTEEQLESTLQIRTLVDKAYQTLADDLLRVSSLSISYLGGAAEIESLFKRVGARAYEHIFFNSYALFLDDKEQYSDAIATYNGYIERNPLNKWSPYFHLEVIDTLSKAGFKRDIYNEKVRFVDQYGITSEYWRFHQGSAESELALLLPRERLETLLVELADRHYVNARNLTRKNKKVGEKASKDYLKAIRYNQEFKQTFAGHKLLAERTLLVAESFLALRDYPQAIANFVEAGYDYPRYETASEAAYASVITYQSYSKSWQSLEAETRKALELEQQANRLRFVDHHRTDKRATSILYSAVSFQYQRQSFIDSLALAERLIAWPNSFEGAPALSAKLDRETKIIKAHSEFELKRYVAAEKSYQDVFALLPKKDKRRKGLVENLAASVFYQAEDQLAQQNIRGAVEHFLRIAAVAPGSSLIPSAEYDAAGYLIELKDWPAAINVLNRFRKNYPKHKLINTLPAKLALAYRETKQWELAASELKTMRRLAKTEEEKKDLQFIVAELYDKAGNKKEAILSYRLWANSYAEPADVYMEVTHRLAELYEQTDKPLKRRFWLAKQMKKVDSLGDKADDRMRFLAAKAASVLANDAFYQYKIIKLKLPLDVSLEKKTKALDKAMKAFQKTASYGISSYATEAGYRMADIYAQLSRDLMDSDRPEGLDELAMEQYEILLEEQAFPFEDSAIEIHEQNASRSWGGIYDEWVKNSFTALKSLLPGRYDKPEVHMEVLDALY